MPIPKWKITKQEVDQVDLPNQGKGIPVSILDRLGGVYDKALAKAAKNTKTRSELYEESQRDLHGSEMDSSRANIYDSKKIPFSEYSFKFNMEDFESDEEEELDPSNMNAQLDVTALDRYNEDVRKYRRIMLEECRQIPLKGFVKRDILERIREAAYNLARSCYYGTYKAHSLGESSVMMFIWLLSRSNLPIWFQIRMLQSLTELVWGSHNLKAKLAPNGVRVLVRLIRGGMAHHTQLACWACYCLLAGAIGSGEVVMACAGIYKIDEYLGEIAFPFYWYDWPANFGSILEGVILGPHAVSPMYEEEFQFL